MKLQKKKYVIMLSPAEEKKKTAQNEACETGGKRPQKSVRV